MYIIYSGMLNILNTKSRLGWNEVTSQYYKNSNLKHPNDMKTVVTSTSNDSKRKEASGGTVREKN